MRPDGSRSKEFDSGGTEEEGYGSHVGAPAWGPVPNERHRGRAAALAAAAALSLIAAGGRAAAPGDIVLVANTGRRRARRRRRPGPDPVDLRRRQLRRL